jgi:hypothetical protein
MEARPIREGVAGHPMGQGVPVGPVGGARGKWRVGWCTTSSLPFCPTLPSRDSLYPLCPLYIEVRWREINTQLNREGTLSSFLRRAISRSTTQDGRQLHPVCRSAARIQIHKIYFRNFPGSDPGASLSIVRVWNYEVMHLRHSTPWERTATRTLGRRRVRIDTHVLAER